MTDAELSKKLGSYQKQARIWILVGLAGAIGGTVSYFAVQNTALKAVLTAVLFFGGVGCAVFLGGGAQKKIKQLMQSEMGDFFKAEFTKAFGEEAHNAKMNIDEKLMKKLSLFEGQWEECETESFHEGEYRKVRFSAANLRLKHKRVELSTVLKSPLFAVTASKSLAMRQHCFVFFLVPTKI